MPTTTRDFYIVETHGREQPFAVWRSNGKELWKFFASRADAEAYLPVARAWLDNHRAATAP